MYFVPLHRRHCTVPGFFAGSVQHTEHFTSSSLPPIPRKPPTLMGTYPTRSHLDVEKLSARHPSATWQPYHLRMPVPRHRSHRFFSRSPWPFGGPFGGRFDFPPLPPPRARVTTASRGAGVWTLRGSATRADGRVRETGDARDIMPARVRCARTAWHCTQDFFSSCVLTGYGGRFPRRRTKRDTRGRAVHGE